MNQYPVNITECRKARRATARLRDGAVHVKLPMRWSRALKKEVTAELVERLTRSLQKQDGLLTSPAVQKQERLTFESLEALKAYIEQLNRETFRYPTLGKIRIGHSKYNHLAQVNLKTRVLTVSKYCLKDVPAEAFRYLMVHELAHYMEAGHNQRFWSLVGRFVPDYKLQSRIIKAFHHQAVQEEDSKPAAPALPAPAPAASPVQPYMPKTGPTNHRPGLDDLLQAARQLKLW